MINNVCNNFEIAESVDEKGKGHYFKSRFIQAGLVSYAELGTVLITKQTLDKFIQTMVGCPVIINHENITDENANGERVGVVSRVWFDDNSGDYWCEGVIWDKQAIGLVKNEGWSVSCAYNYVSDNTAGVYNATDYTQQFIDGDFLHLAIVKNPRYNIANIAINSKDTEDMEDLIVENGGAGSGDFDHAGRPPEVGGSEPAGTGRKGKYKDGKQQWTGAKPESKEDKKEDKSERKYTAYLYKNKDDDSYAEEKTFDSQEKAEEYIKKNKDKYEAYDLRSKDKDEEKSKQEHAGKTAGLDKLKPDSEKSGEEEEKKEDNKLKFDGKNFKELKEKYGDKIRQKDTGEVKVETKDGWKTVFKGDTVTGDKDNIEVHKPTGKLDNTSKDSKQLRLFNGKDTVMTVLNELKSFVLDIVQNAKDDKRAGIDKVAGIMKSAGCDDEDIRTAIGIMEKVAYDKSEAGTADNKCAKNAKEDDKKEVCNEDKRKLIDEIGGILKGQKLDDEIIRTVIGKAEEIAYNPSEKDKADNCGKAKNEKEEIKEGIKEDKKEVKNSLDDVSNILYKGSQSTPESSYMTRAERLELGNKF